MSAYPILYVGLASGLRQRELISLPWAAVDVCGRRVMLEKRWVGHIWRLLTYILLLHKRFLEQVGLEHVSFKNLRHTCVVRALKNKQNVKRLSAMLGHTRASVTRQGYREYVLKAERRKDMCAPRDPAEEEMRQAADKLGELFTI